MNTTGSTITRDVRVSPRQTVGLGESAPMIDICCARLLTAQVPLTLLLDLALPSSKELAELYEEMLSEPSANARVPRQR
jgi:hypothetical protein